MIAFGPILHGLWSNQLFIWMSGWEENRERGAVYFINSKIMEMYSQKFSNNICKQT